MHLTHQFFLFASIFIIMLAYFVIFVRNYIPIQREKGNIILLKNETREITFIAGIGVIHLKSINETFFKLTYYYSQGTLIYCSCVDTLCEIRLDYQGHLIIENLSSYTENTINVIELIDHHFQDLFKIAPPVIIISWAIALFTYRRIGSVVCYERVDTEII
jgi:hypothetical protein